MADPGLTSLLPQNNQDPLFPAPLEQCFLTLPFTKIFLIPCCNLSPLFYHFIIHYWQKHSHASRAFPMCCPPSLYHPQNNPFSPSLQTFSTPTIILLLSPGLFAPMHGTQNWTNPSPKHSQRFTLKTFACFFYLHRLTQSGALPCKPNPGLWGWY